MIQNIETIDEHDHGPRVHMAISAYHDLLTSITSRPPESGGILLGPVQADNVVTGFHFDHGGTCSGTTYSPDHVTLGRMMKETWLPQGLDMKGFCHSHGGGYDTLSPGDLTYIQRLLEANQDMQLFLAPVVLPAAFRVHFLVVLRSDPFVPRTAALRLFSWL